MSVACLRDRLVPVMACVCNFLDAKSYLTRPDPENDPQHTAFVARSLISACMLVDEYFDFLNGYDFMHYAHRQTVCSDTVLRGTKSTQIFLWHGLTPGFGQPNLTRVILSIKLSFKFHLVSFL